MNDRNSIDPSGDGIFDYLKAYSKIEPLLKTNSNVIYDYKVPKLLDDGWSNDRLVQILRKGREDRRVFDE